MGHRLIRLTSSHLRRLTHWCVILTTLKGARNRSTPIRSVRRTSVKTSPPMSSVANPTRPHRQGVRSPSARLGSSPLGKTPSTTVELERPNQIRSPTFKRFTLFIRTWEYTTKVRRPLCRIREHRSLQIRLICIEQ